MSQSSDHLDEKKNRYNMFPDSLLGRENYSPTLVIPQVHAVQFSGKCIPEQAWDYNPVSSVLREMNTPFFFF